MHKVVDFLKNISKYFIIPLCIFFLFKKGIDTLVANTLVKLLFSNCTTPSIIFDVSTILLFLSFIIPIAFKIKGGANIPLRWIYVILFYLTIYTTYRISNQPFQFTSLSFCNQIKLLDVINLIPTLAILGYVLFLVVNSLKTKFNKKVIAINENGFFVDEATKIDMNDDLLIRGKFVAEVANKIKNTETPNASFPIGIVAKWGSGKSTFINTLGEEFLGSEFIVIELNVWKCSNSSQIIETLFKLLKSKLTNYSFTINNKIQDYTFNLLKGTKNDGLNSIKNITELLIPETSIEKQYDSINDEIRRIGKKIIILIDDLDRLDKKEIYEVIRLIRNTANFANTFFIVAYDRNYILNAIEEINTYQAHYFLEKIFQVEFVLPPISEKIIQAEISKKIESFLTTNDKCGYKHLLENGYNFHQYRNGDLTKLFVHNIRDVVRFVNSFKLSYQFVKDEIFIPDFYNLELIKFKHPELFADVYRQYYDFLTTDRDQYNRGGKLENSYALKMIIDDKNKSTGLSELRKYIENRKRIYKLDNREINIVCEAWDAVFPQSGSILSSRTSGTNNHLTVLKPSMLDRYFILGIEGRLSVFEFSKIRNLPKDKFILQLTELSKNEDILNDISEQFEAIKDFDNQEDFENIISGIFHFANLPHPNKKRNFQFESIRYDGKSLSFILGDVKILRFYDNNINEYKKFLLPILMSNSIEYKYTNEFIRSLLHKHYFNIDKILPMHEISNLLLNNFKKVLGLSVKFTSNLWWYFLDCEERKETPIDSQTSKIEYSQNKEALWLMRKFIAEKDIDNFLLFSIVQIHFGTNLTIGDHIKFVFKNNELAIKLLRRYRGTSKYKDEFLRFYDALVSEEYRQEGVPLNFFEVIPIKMRDQV